MDNVQGPARANVAESHKRHFWIEENKKHIPAHYRLRKTGKIINALAAGGDCDLLDVGCGPATLRTVLRPSIRYHGIDIALQTTAANLIETDILKEPIKFGEQRFNIVVAQGLFEYLGHMQSQKFQEIAELLTPNGKFVVTYTNFSHRDRRIFEAFSNVHPIAAFREDLVRHFTIERCFPTAYNWHGGQPTRKLLMAANMNLNVNIPVVAKKLAVEYFFICSRR